MNTILFKKSLEPNEIGSALKITVAMALLWLLAPMVIQFFNPLAGSIDAGIFQLILLALICWIILLFLAKLLAKTVYHKLTLLIAQDIHSPLNDLTLWQHHVLYLASFALLLLSATGCLIAIC